MNNNRGVKGERIFPVSFHVNFHSGKIMNHFSRSFQPEQG